MQPPRRQEEAPSVEAEACEMTSLRRPEEVPTVEADVRGRKTPRRHEEAPPIEAKAREMTTPRSLATAWPPAETPAAWSVWVARGPWSWSASKTLQFQILKAHSSRKPLVSCGGCT